MLTQPSLGAYPQPRYRRSGLHPPDQPGCFPTLVQGDRSCNRDATESHGAGKKETRGLDRQPRWRAVWCLAIRDHRSHDQMDEFQRPETRT
jgi:hypothetical protein